MKGVNRFSDRWVWPLESARIVDFCRNLSGFADFKYTVDRGLAVNLGTDSGLCVS